MVLPRTVHYSMLRTQAKHATLIILARYPFFWAGSPSLSKVFPQGMILRRFLRELNRHAIGHFRSNHPQKVSAGKIPHRCLKNLIPDTDSESPPQPYAWTDFQEAADAASRRKAQDTFSLKAPYE